MFFAVCFFSIDFFIVILVSIVISCTKRKYFISEERTLEDGHDDIGGKAFVALANELRRVIQETREVVVEISQDRGIISGIGGIGPYAVASLRVVERVLVVTYEVPIGAEKKFLLLGSKQRLGQEQHLSVAQERLGLLSLAAQSQHLRIHGPIVGRSNDNLAHEAVQPGLSADPEVVEQCHEGNGIRSRPGGGDQCHPLLVIAHMPEAIGKQDRVDEQVVGGCTAEAVHDVVEII